MTSDLSDSLWHKSCREVVNAAALAKDVQAELVIIGGGYTGLSAALHAALEGVDVRLIEAQEFGAGGSGRNVGLCNAGVWLPPEDVTAKIGAEAGTRLSRILATAPGLVFRLIEQFNIDCEPETSGTLHCAHAPQGMKDLKSRHRQLTDIGAPVQLLSRDEAVSRVGSNQVHGALFDPRAGTIQPLAFAKGLARAAIESGAKLHEHTPATGLQKSGDTWVIETPKGSIIAKNMIVATNAYTHAIEGLDAPKMVPVHYFQAATEPLPPSLLESILPGNEGCWDTALVMSSWRKDQAGRLIIGGMGALGHLGESVHLGWLNRKLAKTFPDLAGMPLSKAWHGRIGMTTEHVPKTIMLDNSAMVTFGYSGRGIGPGTIYGQQMVQALINGDTSGLPRAPEERYGISYTGLRQAFFEAGATMAHLVKDRF